MAASDTAESSNASTTGSGAGFALTDPAQLQTWLSAGQAVLIDVREPDEHARERIDGARLCPLSTFDPAHVVTQVPPGKMIVLHCKGGKRSADAAAMLCRVAAARGAWAPPRCRVSSLGRSQGSMSKPTPQHPASASCDRRNW